MMQPPPDLANLATLAEQAGRRIMDIYQTDFAIEAKKDASPVTEADSAAEAIILAGLAQLHAGVPVIAEEQQAAGQMVAIGEKFFLVDPLDGTREFIARNGEFTVNIGLIENGRPVMGVIVAPALGETYIGQVGLGAWRVKDGITAQIKARPCPPQGPTIFASRSHGDDKTTAFIAEQKAAAVLNAGSSLKFCRLAEGQGDLYPRFGRTMEWDTAAGHAILAAAGGSVATFGGAELAYGKSGFANPGYLARGR